MVGASLLLVGLLLWITYVWVTDMEEIGMFQRIMITFFPLLVTPLMFKIELPKIKRLIITSQGLTIKNTLFGRTTKFDWKDIDGYQTVLHFTRGGSLKELMLIADNKVIHEVSENYIKNYKEVQRVLTRNLKNLGPINYNYFRFIKERLFR